MVSARRRDVTKVPGGEEDGEALWLVKEVLAGNVTFDLNNKESSCARWEALSEMLGRGKGRGKVQQARISLAHSRTRHTRGPEWMEPGGQRVQ